MNNIKLLYRPTALKAESSAAILMPEDPLDELKAATGNLLSVIDKLNRQKNDALWSKCKSIQIEQECNHFFSWTYAKPSDEELIREILREL
jgi:hypothetical protein